MLEGRQHDDVFQAHYRLNTKETIESVARRSGFHLEWIHHVFSAPLTQMLGPAVIVELLLTRFFGGERFASWRPDLIASLRKPAAKGDSVAFSSPSVGDLAHVSSRAMTSARRKRSSLGDSAADAH
jgi:hypothetical protein